MTKVRCKGLCPPGCVPLALPVQTCKQTEGGGNVASELSHFDDNGASRMVDVGSKPVTPRLARARCFVNMQPGTLNLIRDRQLAKGDVLEVARLAGIMAAKRTGDLIPLCHPLPLTHIDVRCELRDELPGVAIRATVRTTGKTGVEMEALTAVAVAALTVYDMAKAVEKTMQITSVRLLEKHGGQSGDVVVGDD